MNTNDIFKAIEESSEKILIGDNDLNKRVKSAKNYVANQDLNKWAFSKLIATENFNITYGSQAKPFFYGYNFVNILSIKNGSFKSNVIKRFLDWSDKIDYIAMRKKFELDQNTTMRFELLVHIDQIPKEVLNKEKLLERNLDEFIEGFRRQVIVENGYRNRKFTLHAKEELGTICYACGFNFEDFYGPHGKGFIEIHHLNPIQEGERSSRIEDVVPVCSNCHRMLHKGTAILTIEDLKQMIIRNKAST
jgi:predicted HNH restriction endonuclease